MSQIYGSLKNLISPALISKASDALGENTSKVSSAVSTILPSLLGKLLKVGNTSQVADIVEDAGRNSLWSRAEDIFMGRGIIDNKNYGERFESAVLGAKDSNFISAIASKSGLKNANVDKLVTWVSGAIAAFLGDKVVNGNRTVPSLLADLEKEKSSLRADIPNDIAKNLGINSLLGVDSYDARTTNPDKKGNGWIWWLIIILLLLVLLFFWWRSCDRRTVTDNDYRSDRVIERVDNATDRAANAVATTANNIADSVRNKADRVRTEMTLPDGSKISVYKNGCEDRMISYLNSNDFKNASADDLKNKWFEFDNIDFKHDSATELESGSQAQLNNLVAVLKNYPDAKIRIGGYADKTGSRLVNEEISKQRAEYIKSQFVKAGIAANRVSTEGFGEEFATVPEDATDQQRAIDRNIAVRFVK